MTAEVFVQSLNIRLAFLYPLISIAANQITDRCAKCKYKIDYGDKDVCCTDCSKPILVDKNSKFGYCATGAELAMQLKPQEVFKWNAGPWMECSSPCDGGVRYRDVGCFGRIEDTSIEHYPVDDSRCSPHGMEGVTGSSQKIQCCGCNVMTS
ncbi:hypothetical protein QJS04_geneDACA005592 [Acorus gramineus]|uniref:Uncharacterized protein n=1 Tax=Acorus gramineus TaxID=55184 RepID=A0AAV9A5S8_ACOGR|nr:hypothetical protein QJS04_geneDACA005592 [Acorus gramineus]